MWITVLTSDGCKHAFAVEHDVAGKEIEQKLVAKLHFGDNERFYFGLTRRGKWIHDGESPLVEELDIKVYEYPICVTYKPKLMIHPTRLESREAKLHYFHSVVDDMAKGRCFLSYQQAVEFRVLQTEIAHSLKVDSAPIPILHQQGIPDEIDLKIKLAKETTRHIGASFDQSLLLFLCKASELALNGLHQFSVKCKKLKGVANVTTDSVQIYAIEKDTQTPILHKRILFRDVVNCTICQKRSAKIKYQITDKTKISLRFSSKSKATNFFRTYLALVAFNREILPTLDRWTLPPPPAPLPPVLPPSPAPVPTPPTESSSSSSSSESTRSVICKILSSQIRVLRRGINCKRCRERPIDAAYYPCLHACHCASCASKRGEPCAVCGAKIDTLLEHYWS
ncbi:uncharacterized protein [Oscarella lobularis]|uniref:uncharacterized protein n=1 Tax=Oscarella lobularis TaxID=121494 RepID=UPI003313F7D2